MIEKIIPVEILKNKGKFGENLAHICDRISLESHCDVAKRIELFTDFMNTARLHDRRHKDKVSLEDRASAIAQEVFENEILWELPKDFGATMERPIFPISSLPPVLADYLKAVAEYVQVDENMCVLPMLSVLSLCSQGKALVQNPGNKFTQNINLYTLTIAESGERKSGAFAEFMRPVEEYAKSWNERNKSNIRHYKTEVAHWQEQRRKAIAKSNLNAAQQADDELERLAANPVHEMRPNLTDATPEAIVKTMKNYGEQLGILSDESGILNVISGLYSNSKSNIDIFLNAYDGKETFVTRASKEDAHLDEPLLTIGLMGQPSVFADFMGNDEFTGRGLTARFMFAFPQSKFGFQSFRSQPIPESISKAYEKIILHLLCMKKPDSMPILTFDREAETILEGYHNSLQEKARKGNLLENCKEWAAKHYSRALRLAAILHLCEHEPSEKIGGNSAIQAIKICMWSENQMLFALETTETENIRNAKYILEILRKIVSESGVKCDTVVVPKGQLLHKAYKLNKKQMEEPLEILESMNCLKIEESLSPKGTQKIELKINPLI